MCTADLKKILSRVFFDFLDRFLFNDGTRVVEARDSIFDANSVCVHNRLWRRRDPNQYITVLDDRRPVARERDSS